MNDNAEEDVVCGWSPVMSTLYHPPPHFCLIKTSSPTVSNTVTMSITFIHNLDNAFLTPS